MLTLSLEETVSLWLGLLQQAVTLWIMFLISLSVPAALFTTTLQGCRTSDTKVIYVKCFEH